MTEEIKLTKPKFIKIEAVKPGAHGYNVYVKVISCKKEEITKFNGEKLKIAEVILGDSTAVIEARIAGSWNFSMLRFLSKEKCMPLEMEKAMFSRKDRDQSLMNLAKLHLKMYFIFFQQFGKKSKNVESVNEKNNLSSILYEKIVKKVN